MGMLESPFETNDAYHFNNGFRVVWLPKSLCEWIEDDAEMLMPEWLAIKEGLV
jgi:hypothetical protein